MSFDVILHFYTAHLIICLLILFLNRGLEDPVYEMCFVKTTSRMPLGRYGHIYRLYLWLWRMFHSCMVCCPRELEMPNKQGCQNLILTILKCFRTGITFNVLHDMNKHYENLQSQYVQVYGYKQYCMNSKRLALIKETQERKGDGVGQSMGQKFLQLHYTTCE